MVWYELIQRCLKGSLALSLATHILVIKFIKWSEIVLHCLKLAEAIENRLKTKDPRI